MVCFLSYITIKRIIKIKPTHIFLFKIFFRPKQHVHKKFGKFFLDIIHTDVYLGIDCSYSIMTFKKESIS